MKNVIIALFCFLSIGVYSQETNPAFDGHKWEAPYHLPTPKDWGIERFPIPISFAPSISYKGVEDIRFTPGWAKQNTDEYWSYAFLWYLEGEINVNAAQIENNLKAYYTGLVAINGAEIPKEKMIAVQTSFKEIKKETEDIQTFEGTVKMTDYMQQKPITLQVRVHRKKCSGLNNTYIFYELSPQPYTHKVWIDIKKLWVGFRCAKINN